MNTGTVANRIEQALAYGAKGTLPADHTDQLREDIDSMKARYSELKRNLSFDEASSVARTEFIMRVLQDMKKNDKPIYYDCGICDHFHPWGWNEDCRDDANRLTYDDLDKRHGENGYELRSMEERINDGSTRQPKYNKIWDWIGDFNTSPEDGGNGFETGIEMLLRFMPDNELDMVIAEMESYCPTCMVPEHDACSMTDGCPCCENTKQRNNRRCGSRPRGSRFNDGINR